MTCLSIIQSVCLRVGLPKPNAAITSSDTKIQQMLELLDEEGQELAARHSWQALTILDVFTTVASNVQFSFVEIPTVADGSTTTNANARFIVNNTIWNKSTRLPIYGCLSPQEWEMLAATSITGPYSRYRIVANSMEFIPVPVAGQTCVYEWVSTNWVRGQFTQAGVPYIPVLGTVARYGSDADLTVLDEQILALGTIWRWKAAKGLPYAEDFAKYEKRVVDAIGRDGSKPILSMGGEYCGIQPVVMVSAGSWNV